MPFDQSTIDQYISDAREYVSTGNAGWVIVALVVGVALIVLNPKRR